MLTTVTGVGSEGSGFALVVIVVCVLVPGGWLRGETSNVIKAPVRLLVMVIIAVRIAGSLYTCKNRDAHRVPTPIAARIAIATTIVQITLGEVFILL